MVRSMWLLVMLLPACAESDQDKAWDPQDDVADDPGDAMSTDSDAQTSDTEAPTDEAPSDDPPTDDTDDPPTDAVDTEPPSDTDEPPPVRLFDGQYAAGSISLTRDSCGLGEQKGFYLDVTGVSGGYDMEIPGGLGTFGCSQSAWDLTCSTVTFSKSSGVTLEYTLDMTATVRDTRRFDADHEWVIRCTGSGCGSTGVSWPCYYDFSASFQKS